MTSLTLSALNINSRGNKTATVLDGGQRLVQTFTEPARCLFGPFLTSTRMKAPRAKGSPSS